MKSHYLPEKFEEILQSDEWWAFENLSRIPVLQQSYWNDAQKICRRFRQLDCKFQVREMLRTHPFCACSFNLSQIADWEVLPQTLSQKIDQGISSYRRSLIMLKQTLVPMLEQFAAGSPDREFTDAAVALTKGLREGKLSQKFTQADLAVLHHIFASLGTTPMVDLNMPQSGEYMNREELRRRLDSWIDELPGSPVLVKI
jgi:hypothetical protein